MPGNREFGNKIRKLRDAKKAVDPKFSLRQFAKAVDISATYLSRIENGDFDPPSPETIKKMAGLLGTDADELLALAGKTDPKLHDIIRERPKIMADFLRKASGMSEKDLKKIIKDLPDKKD